VVVGWIFQWLFDDVRKWFVERVLHDLVLITDFVHTKSGITFGEIFVPNVEQGREELGSKN
jgi:hypothetical protein